MSGYANGLIPLALLVHLGGDHYLPPGTAARWRWLQRTAWEKYGVWLVITAGWNAYRPLHIQVIYKRDLGRWAAAPGFSTHGGKVNGREVFAIDVSNWAVLGWSRFAALCRLAGFTVNFVSPEELWHIGDYNDAWAVPAGANTIPTINPATTRQVTYEEDDVSFICATPINGWNGDAGYHHWICDPAAGTKRNIDLNEFNFLAQVGVRKLAGAQSPEVTNRYTQIN